MVASHIVQAHNPEDIQNVASQVIQASGLSV
uniref:Uncharacterized protein n=1 Tax=Bartonella schoenbuchensis TaxID=165694 RepID=A0A024LSE0_9HYPH|nr:hypothetical protein BN1046_01232 [Bartonella schoenbuchensis]